MSLFISPLPLRSYSKPQVEIYQSLPWCRFQDFFLFLLWYVYGPLRLRIVYVSKTFPSYGSSSPLWFLRRHRPHLTWSLPLNVTLSYLLTVLDWIENFVSEVEDTTLSDSPLLPPSSHWLILRLTFVDLPSVTTVPDSVVVTLSHSLSNTDTKRPSPLLLNGFNLHLTFSFVS